MSDARREDFWQQFDDDDGGDLAAAERYVERNPDATVAEVLGQTGLDLDRRDEIVALLEDSDDRGEPTTRVGHWMAGDCDVYGGRSTTGQGRIRHFGNTEIGERGWLGNPFVHEDGADDEHHAQGDVTVVATREQAVARFADLFLDAVDARHELRRALYEDVRGGVLGGWCQSVDDDGPACHLEVVAAVADAISKRGGAE
ncbi:DUF4326 domain-containing protein [Natronoarchaeum rubrum]|uniref:DUF4326 domain-containing protein n=1 Tax=Natronoarchaeum rubrum TaxID=755311 RepID=UPI0021115095|nr:DUF4326 domain-containing protein [Natronoarchaeum rubrum]